MQLFLIQLLSRAFCADVPGPRGGMPRKYSGPTKQVKRVGNELVRLTGISRDQRLGVFDAFQAESGDADATRFEHGGACRTGGAQPS